MARPSQVWRSRLPLFLKMGVGGAAEALANADGTYDKPLTVTRLLAHRYYDGLPLSKRAIQYQLRALEATRVLVVRDASARVSRYRPRDYWFNAAALANVDLSLPELRPPHRRKGATQGCNTRVQQTLRPTCFKGATKGATQGCNRNLILIVLIYSVQKHQRCAPVLWKTARMTRKKPAPSLRLRAEAKVRSL
jgi:hypothetical protein